jgi:hypothetical protein
VKVEIQMPDHLSEQEFDLFRKLAALRSSPDHGGHTRRDRY